MLRDIRLAPPNNNPEPHDHTCKRCKRLIGREAHDTPLYIDECCALAIPQLLREMGFCVVPQLKGAQDGLPP